MLPIAAAFALVIALATGSYTGWKTQGEMEAEEKKYRDAHPGVSGVLKRWFFWYVYNPRTSMAMRGVGPFQMTDQEAFELERQTKSSQLGVMLYRFVWPGRDPWIYDTRSDPALLASREVAPGVAGSHLSGLSGLSGPSVGAVRISPALTGKWPTPGAFPHTIVVNRRTFTRARWEWRKHPHIIAQYREDKHFGAQHLYVLRDGTWLINHTDNANPDKGHAMEHLMQDVMKPMRDA